MRDGQVVGRRRFIGAAAGAAAATVALPARTAEAQSSPIAVVNEILFGSDARIGLVADSKLDQSDKLRLFYRMLCEGAGGKDRVGQLHPGTYMVSGSFDLPNLDGHKPVVIRGAGGMLHHDAPTVLRWAKDAGPNAYALNPIGKAPFTVQGLSFYGSASPPAKGSVGWQMRGVHLPTRCWVSDISVLGFFGNIVISGDHLRLWDFISQAGTYNIEFPPNIQTQGDIKIWNGQASAAHRGAIGVAKSSQMAGVRMQDVELSTSPYVIHRYDDGGTKTVPTWLNGVEVLNAATEYTGNGIVCNDVDDSSINQVVFDHGVTNWGLYTANVWPGKLQRAAWYNLGAITGLQFVNGLPYAMPTKPALLARALIEVTYQSARGSATAMRNGTRYFDLLAKNGSYLQGSYIGGNCGPQMLVVPYLADGPIQRGDVLTNQNEWGVVQYNVGATAKRAVGIAGHDAVKGDVVHVLLRGIGTDIDVRNTSGADIAPGELLVPHAGGGVASAGAFWWGQVVGRALYKIAKGATGQAELFF